MNPREQMRQTGAEVMAILGHGMNPPRKRALYSNTLPGAGTYSHEALFGEVWTRPGLDLRLRLVATISVLVCRQFLAQLRTYLNSALNMGLAREELREVLLQASIFAGFPATVNAFELYREVLEARGLPLDYDDAQPSHDAPVEQLDADGRALRARLSGSRRTQDTLDELEARYAFGVLMSRAGLDQKARAVAMVACLVAVDAPDDLGHTAGTMTIGGVLTRDEIVEVVLQSAYYTGFPSARTAMRALSR